MEILNSNKVKESGYEHLGAMFNVRSPPRRGFQSRMLFSLESHRSYGIT